MAVPPDRGPGTAWKPGPAVDAAEAPLGGAPIRIGYARCSTAQQELQIQTDALTQAHCTRIFSEKGLPPLLLTRGVEWFRPRVRSG